MHMEVTFSGCTHTGAENFLTHFDTDLVPRAFMAASVNYGTTTG